MNVITATRNPKDYLRIGAQARAMARRSKAESDRDVAVLAKARMASIPSLARIFRRAGMPEPLIRFECDLALREAG